jgi:hypothetical protein
LNAKWEKIQLSIRLYEERIKQATAELARITAAIKIFEATGDPQEMDRYINTHQLVRLGEPIELCKEALVSGPRSTREQA